MKYLKKIFETNSFFDINQNIFDDIDYIQDFIDDIDEKYGVNCRCIIRCGTYNYNANVNASNLQEFKMWVKEKINQEIPTIQYSISESISSDYDDNYLIESLKSLKDRLSNTDCRVDQLNVTTTSKYLEQFSKNGKPTRKNSNEEYQHPYLITKSKTINFSISISNLKLRYNI